MASTHTTPIAAKGIDKGNLASRHITDGTKLARRKASSTATATLLGGLGHVLSSEKEMKTIAITHQSQAIGSVAVAEATDKGCFEGPEGVYEGLLFIGAQ